MFAIKIIDSDEFLDMPLSAQALYFHLSMRADDEGFIDNSKKIRRMIGASEDDLKLLITKNFIIPFNNGITVVTHWKIHNYIPKDRFKSTMYESEREMLELDKKGMYTTCIQPVDNLYTTCIQPVDNLYTTCIQPVYTGKDRLGKDNIYINTNSAPDGAQCAQMHTDSEQTEPVTVVSQEKDTQTAGASDDSYTHSVTVSDGKCTHAHVQNENAHMHNAQVNALFERLWELYPNKKGKARVSDKTKRELYKHGEEQIKRCIDRYLDGLRVDEWRKPQNGSTFFMSGYVDYLDENYEGVNSNATARGNPETSWGNDIDWGEL